MGAMLRAAGFVLATTVLSINAWAVTPYTIPLQSPTTTNPDTLLPPSSLMAGALPGNGGATPSGGYQYKMPVELPPGIHGLAPQLALTYSSQAGNGMLGRGWSLSGLSSISRCPQTIAQNGIAHPVSLTTADVFCLDGQQLVHDPSDTTHAYGADGAMYRTELDGFSRIVSNGITNNAPDHFTVYTKDGRVMTYGGSAKERLFANTQSSATSQRVDTTTPVTWALSTVTDRWSNYWTVTYTKPLDASSNALGELLPYQIAYTGNTTQSQTPSFTVTFSYSTSPVSHPVTGHMVAAPGYVVGPPSQSYWTGSIFTRDRVLSGLSIQQNVTAAQPGGTTVRNYNFGYVTYASEYPDALDAQLAYVQKCDGSTPANCLPATQFTYSPTNTKQDVVGKVEYTPPAGSVTSNGTTNQVFQTRSGQSVDFNGDGYTDIAVASPVVLSGQMLHVSLLMGGALAGQIIDRSIPSSSVTSPDAAKYFDDASQFQVADIDRDGHPDLIFVGDAAANTTGQSYPLAMVSRSKGDASAAYSAQGGWSVSLGANLQNNYGFTHVAIVDVDGDGYPDVVKYTYYVDGPSNSMYHISIAVGRNKGWQLDGVTDPLARQQLETQLDQQGWFDWATPAQGGTGYYDFYDNYQGLELGYTNTAGSSYTQMGNISLVDTDGDGLPDIVGYGYQYGLIWVLKNLSTPGHIQFYRTPVGQNQGPSWAGNYPGSTKCQLGPYDAYGNWSVAGSLNQAIWRDVNGDGIEDLVVTYSSSVSPAGTSACIYLGTATGGPSPPIVVPVDASIPVGGDWPTPLIYDVNMDGHPDLVYVSASTAKGATIGVSPGRGDGTFTPGSTALIGHCDATVSGTTTTYSNWCDSQTTTPSYPSESYLPYVGMDAGGKSYVGFLHRMGYSGSLDYYGRHDAGVGNSVGLMLWTVTDGLGKQTGINYTALRDPAIPGLYTYTPSTTADQQQGDLTAPLPVVSSVVADTGGIYMSPSVTTNYTYQGGRVSLTGRGLLGFSQITATTQPSITQPDGTTVTPTLTTQTQYWQLFPCTGQVKQQDTYNGPVATGVHISNATNAIALSVFPTTGSQSSLTCNTSSDPGITAGTALPVIAVPSTTNLVATQYNVDTPATLSTTTTNRTLDSYGNVASEQVTQAAAGGTPWFTTQTNNTYVWQTAGSNSSTYTNVDTVNNHWYADLLDNVVVTQTRSGDPAGTSHSQKVAYSYNGTQLFKVITKVEQAYNGATAPGSTDTTFGLQTDGLTYDGYGNVLTSTVHGSGDGSGLITPPPAPFGTSVSLTQTDTYASGTNYPTGLFKSQSSTNVSSYADGVARTTTMATSRTYDPATGAVLTETAPDGTQTQNLYDPLGRLTKTQKFGAGASSAYDTMAVARLICGSGSSNANDCQAGEAVRVATTPAGSTVSYTYLDRLGRENRQLTPAFDGTWIGVETHYDELGRVRCKSLPGYGSTSTTGATCNGNLAGWAYSTYDAYGRTTSTRAPNGAVTGTAYNGLATTITNPLTNQRQETKDILGRMTQVLDGYTNGSTCSSTACIQYGYDVAGNLVQTKDTQGNVVAMTYNALGRKTSMTDPDMGTWSYVYDALGNQIQQTDGKGLTTYSYYDQLGRLYQRSEPDRISSWQYDVQGTVSGVNGANVNGAGAIGALAWASTQSKINGVWTIDYQRFHWYDAAGRSKDTVYVLGAGARTYSEHTDYDAGTVNQPAANRPTTLVYNAALVPSSNYTATALTAPSAEGYNNVYNSYGYLSQVTDYNSGLLKWQANTMDAQGHVTSFTLGNGLTTTRTYNATSGTMSGVVTAVPPPSNCGTHCPSPVQNDSYGYDVLGNLLTRNRVINNLQETFGYDPLNRLISNSMLLNGVTTPVNQTYDNTGNITYKSDVGYYSYTATATCPGKHKVCAISGSTNTTFDYDLNGNLLAGNGRSYKDSSNNSAWTSYNMPGSITDTASGAIETFIYNGEHERVQHKVTSGNVTTTTYYVNPRVDLGGHFEETDTQTGTSAATTEYTHYLYAGGEVFGSLVNTNVGASTTDWNGTLATAPTTALSNTAGITMPSPDPAGLITYTAPSGSSPGNLTFNTVAASPSYSASARGQREYQGSQSVVFRARVTSNNNQGNARIGLVNKGSGSSLRSVELVYALPQSGAWIQATTNTGAITPISTGFSGAINFVIVATPASTCAYAYQDGDYLGSSSNFKWCSTAMDWGVGGTQTFATQLTGTSWSSTVPSQAIQVSQLSETVGDHRYFHSDNLGSIAVVTDSIGNALEYLSYDPWGRRRALDGNPTEAWASNFSSGWDKTALLPPASDPSNVIGPTASSSGLPVNQPHASVYQATATGARRYAANAVVTFNGQLTLPSSGSMLTRAYAQLGVGNSGSTASSTRRHVFVVYNNGQFQILYRGDSNPGADQTVNLSTTVTAGATYNVSIVTSPLNGTQAYLWLSTQSQPTTPTWSSTVMTWDAGTGQTKALEIVGQTTSGTGGGVVSANNLTENEAYLNSRYTAKHGFTGHEHLESVGLIDMNGRVFDPTVARFVSADPNVPDPFDTQSFNRYSYVDNDPLNWVDPSGYDLETWNQLTPYTSPPTPGPNGPTSTTTYGCPCTPVSTDMYAENSGSASWSWSSASTDTIQTQLAQSSGIVQIGNYYGDKIAFGSSPQYTAPSANLSFTYTVNNSAAQAAIPNTPASAAPAPQQAAQAVTAISNGYKFDPISGRCGICIELDPAQQAAQNKTLFGMAMFPIFGVEEGAVEVGEALTVANGAKAGEWTFGAFKSEAKWTSQLEKRGWTKEQITEAISKGERFPAENLVNKGNSATRYVHPTTGQSVVIDDVTKEVIHVGGPGFKY